MRRMTNQQWESVWAVFVGLWPRIDATDEQQMSFRRVCDGCNEVEAIAALRALSDRSAKIPRPADLATVMREDRRRKAGGDIDREAARVRLEQEQMDRVDAAWREIDEVISGMGDAELDGHKRMILAANPSLSYLAGAKVRSSRLLKSHVIDRFRRGFGPEDRVSVQWLRPSNGGSGPLLDYGPNVVEVNDFMLAQADAALAQAVPVGSGLLSHLAGTFGTVERMGSAIEFARGAAQ